MQIASASIRFDPPQNEETQMRKIRTPLVLSAALLASIATTSAFAQDAAA